MTDQQARQYVLDNPAEFGLTAIAPADVAGRVLHSPAGFAIVRPLGEKPVLMLQSLTVSQGFEPVLAFLWVDPAHRGQGHGQRLIRQALRLHGQCSDVTAACCGPDRLRLFRRCGFTVDSSDGEWHRLRWRNTSLLAGMLRGW